MDIKIMVKSMGIAFFVPIIINSIIIPLAILVIRINGTSYNLDQGVYMITQMFTPFLASFWIYLHMTQYVDIKGNENYYIKNRSKMMEIIKLYLLYIFTNTPLFIWYISLKKKYALEWVHIIILSFVFVSFAYFFCYLLNSISLALIPSFLYLLISMTELNPAFKKISFYEYEGMSGNQLFSKYCYFLIVAIVVMGIGNILNRHYEEYNL